MATPLIYLEGGPGAGVHGWTGDWPPELELWVAVGRTSRAVSFTSRAVLESTGIELAELHRLCEVTRYRRHSYSNLPAEVDAMPHVSRAALYKVATDD